MDVHKKKILKLLDEAYIELEKINYTYLSEIDEASSLVNSAIWLVKKSSGVVN